MSNDIMSPDFFSDDERYTVKNIGLKTAKNVPNIDGYLSVIFSGVQLELLRY